MPDDIQIRVIVDQSAATFAQTRAQVDSLATGLNSASAAGADAGNKIADGMRKGMSTTTEARHAMRGLGEEIGVHIPRFVSSFVSTLPGVQNAMASAFSVIAIIGIVEVLSQIPAAIDKIVGKFSGWDEAAKKTYNDILAENAKLMLSNVTLGAQIAGISTIGLEGMAKYAAEVANGKTELQAYASVGAMAARQVTDIQAQIDKIEFEKAVVPYASLAAHVDGVNAKITELTESMKRWQKVSEEAAAKGRELQLVKLPTLGAERRVAAADEVAKNEARNSEYLRQMAERDNRDFRLAQETAAKKIALDEQLDKDTHDAAVRDLAAFEEIARGKRALQEATLTSELADMRSQAAERQAILKAGGAGPETIVPAATEAYSEQAAKIAELIALEQQFRATVLDANDPAQIRATIESLIKEQSYVRELNAAWLANEKIVAAAAEKTRLVYARAIEGISSEFSRGFTSWMSGQERFGRAMQSVWSGIATSVVGAMIRVGFQMVANWALGKSLDDATKLREAKSAAVGGFKSVMQAVPFPFNVVLAPIVAAGAFAAVMAFEKGGLVPATGMAMVHKGEMVLPAHVTAQMMRQSASSGRNLTVNYNPSVSGINTAGIKDMLDAHGALFVASLIKQMRRQNV